AHHTTEYNGNPRPAERLWPDAFANGCGLRCSSRFCYPHDSRSDRTDIAFQQSECRQRPWLYTLSLAGMVFLSSLVLAQWRHDLGHAGLESPLDQRLCRRARTATILVAMCVAI